MAATYLNGTQLILNRVFDATGFNQIKATPYSNNSLWRIVKVRKQIILCRNRLLCRYFCNFVRGRDVVSGYLRSLPE
jgi:hypothetical protein